MANQKFGKAAGVMLVAAVASLGVLAALASDPGAVDPSTAAGKAEPKAKISPPTKDEQVMAGKTLYAANCSACHQPDGTGVADEVPPLAGSDFLLKGPEHAIAVVLHGLKGELKVHGKAYDATMPQMIQLTNEEVADVLTFVYNSWGNPGGQIQASDVAAQRYDRALAAEAK